MLKNLDSPSIKGSQNLTLAQVLAGAFATFINKIHPRQRYGMLLPAGARLPHGDKEDFLAGRSFATILCIFFVPPLRDLPIDCGLFFRVRRLHQDELFILLALSSESATGGRPIGCF